MSYRNGPGYNRGYARKFPPNSDYANNNRHSNHYNDPQNINNNTNFNMNNDYQNYSNNHYYNNGNNGNGGYSNNSFHQQQYSNHSYQKYYPNQHLQQQNQQPHLANKVDNNIPKSTRNNIPFAPSSKVDSKNSLKPIVKKYRFDNKNRGNLLSELNSSNSNKNSSLKTFKLISIKEPNNSSNKKHITRYLNGLSEHVKDPRIESHSLYSKSLSKSFSNKVDKLYLPNFKFDKFSLGDKPSNEILIWNLHSSTTYLIIKNNYSAFGPVAECKIIDDPLTAVPMGICLLSFDGKIEQAHKSALNAVESTNKKLLIQGRCVRCALNVKNEIYNKIYKKTIEVRDEIAKKQKKEELENERKAQLDKRREEFRISQEIKIKRQKQINNNINNNINNTNTSNTNVKNNIRSIHSNNNSNQIISKQSVHDNHILPLSSAQLPYKLQRYINNRPVIYIADKYVSSMHVSSDQIKRFLFRYNIERVLQQRTGFFVVFKSLKEAITCFDNEDGKKYMSFTVYMTLYIPDNQIDDTRVGKSGTIKLAQKEITKELNAYLLKDVREKFVSNLIMDVLNNDEIIKLSEDALNKKKMRDEELQKQKIIDADLKGINGKENTNVKLELETVTVIKRLDLNGLQKKRIQKAFVPMSHSLNNAHVNNSQSEETDDDDDEDDEDDEDDDNDTDKGEKNEEQQTGNSIVKLGDKRKKADQYIEEEYNAKKIKVESIKQETDEDEDINDSHMNTDQSEITSPEIDSKILEPIVDNEFQPSTSVETVYKDTLDTFEPTVEYLKKSIKTKEDFEILSSLCKNIKHDKPIKDVRFWAWNHMQTVKESKKLKEIVQEENEDNGEVFDFEDEVLENKELENSSGCFRTQGYYKIPDKFKRIYMLHRRKLTNLNPVKHEGDDESNAQTHNNVQSSRVNRANTRRFVADISAQKQIIGETDLLDLNQLNKRKKPVQFARSAIHNWGLYALEPISAREMIIEYVGERIRQQVAEVREKNYLRSGIGSSYLFRVDENTVIDASKKGGIARFINHCCEPSCTAKIIKVGGKKRIVIYALRDIKRNEELTYDYKFERETNDEERIPCLCGAPGCKGYLN